MELAFAALHQLCAPLLDRLDALPGAAARRAASRVRALRPGPRRTGSWSGWPLLSLLAEVAEERPLLCVVDDAQWLDQASAQVLGVRRAAAAGRVGRRWCSPRATRPTELRGLPELEVGGCGTGDARALLGSVVRPAR